MYDEWAANITSANNLDSPDIYGNYARAGRQNASAASVAAPRAQAEVAVDSIKKENEARRKANAKAVLLPENQGYAFLDGDGNRIGINEFSLLTGQRPDEILRDSPNPKDQKFVSDYMAMTKFTSAWVNGDQAALAEMRAADPDRFNQLISTYQSPNEVVKAFTDYWSDYYKPNSNSQSSNTSSFAPGQKVPIPTGDLAAVLGSTPATQTLTPMAGAPPRELRGFEKINPFAGQRDEINRYQDYLKSNPWFQYQNSLMGL